ncbi:FAD binding domain-containing protein [Rhodococcus sp. IEGM 1366]|uniref:FAD binding domain-containing protein n=1 Tax=Rhodococcus sp. IEGM 1366 TaxID=3082223 RepID=UPI002953338E|nr:FAD binding domain-containing protein [Rhodococcus sp. IEGM 1366]MDV8071347.1 FAD binding domain-containing protein [Rhodococcus sp. IEGM 1366]
MKPAPFNYHRVHTPDQAVTLLAELGDDAKLIAGGQSLVAMMNFRLARPAQLIDIGEVAELRYVHRGNDGLRIGALTTHHAIESEYRGTMANGFEVIVDAMQWIGHLPIRTRGTIGGSIAHADATAEWCLLAVLLDAEIVVLSVRGRRSIPAGEFFYGFYSTALEPDEMIVEIHFPATARHAAMAEYAQRHGDFAVVAAAVNLQIEDGSIQGGRVVLGGVGPLPVIADSAGAALSSGQPLSSTSAAECASETANSLDLDDTVPGGAVYTRGLVRHLVTRALCKAAQLEESVR